MVCGAVRGGLRGCIIINIFGRGGDNHVQRRRMDEGVLCR